MARRSQTNLPSPQAPSRLRHGDYTVAIICPMGDELSPVLALLDEVHENLSTGRDQNAYKLGRMGHHNVVVAGMPEIGNNAAAMVATQLLNDFSQIRFALLVGIGGGIPDDDYEDDDLNDIRLGDVVVGHSRGAYGGVIQFDRGKATTEGFVVTGHQSRPPHVLAANVEILKASHNLHGNSIPRYLGEMLARYPGMKDKYSSPGSERDCVFEAGYTHEGGKTCKNCNISRMIEREQRRTENPRIHYGTIGSSNTVVKDSNKRDALRKMGVLCVEMEAAGLMEAFPCLVIRGISDYADSHKNKKWQPYAAATAAAYSKELLLQIPQVEVQRTQSITDAVEGLSMKIDRVERGTRILVGQTQNEAEMTILEWLSPNDVNFSNLQNESQQTHTAGTGQWLLDHESYQNWRDHEPGLLWLHGVAGCGKTILCSTIIQDLQQNFPHSAYWYFRFDSHISQDVSQMLRSIMRQLSLSPLPLETRSLYDRHGQHGSAPSLEELTTALSCTMGSITQDIYIVLDALDECPHKDKKGQRDRLLHCIKTLRTTHPRLHLLVTSRPEPDIERDLRSVVIYDMDIEQPIRSDVERFVKATLEDHRLASWTEDVRDQIIAKLLEYEERRFRWADLQIKRFAQCPNIEQLRKAMNSVPKDLEAAYRQAFDAIGDENTTHVAKIMMWLTASVEPLSADQITAIAGFRDPDYVLQICSTLLVTIIDEDTTQIIKLAHFSVKEFLVLKLYEISTQWYRFTMEYANQSIALFALERLLFPQEELKHILPYAARYWPLHATEGLKVDDKMELEEQICLLFNHEYRGQFLGWLNMHNPDNVNGYQSYRPAEPLYYASLLGFERIVPKIWVNISQLSRNEGRYGNALNAAAICGNVSVVRWMLRNCEGSAGFLDLVRAAGEIHTNATECVAEICNTLADFAITEDVVRAAAENESSGQQVMKALLENRGDEVQVTEDIVSAAAGNWDSGQQVIDLLLKKRKHQVRITEEVVRVAFANKYSGRQILRTILESQGDEARITEKLIRIAIENGETGQQIIELLLETREKEKETHFTEEIASLIMGAFDTPSVRLLMEKRGERILITEMIIEAAAKSHLYGPQVMELLLVAKNHKIQLTEAVIMAAAGNRTSGRQVLEVLLRKANFMSPVMDSITCLIAENFDARAMKLLLEKNTGDIRLTEELLKSCASNGENGKQVLEVLLSMKKEKVHRITEPVVRAAARNFRSGQEVMELLLSERAETVQMTDKVFKLVACHWTGAKLMKLLSESIEEDAIPDRLTSATNMRNITAVEALRNRLDQPTAILNEAISRKDRKTAERLLENGAQHQNKGWRHSLRQAAALGLTRVVELLLKIGVDQTAGGADERTPLMHALRWNHIDTARLLLDHGADLTVKDAHGDTTLTLAIYCERLQIVETLLRSGADQNDRGDRGWTPLMYASYAGIAGTVDLLLTHGADHTLTDDRGDRALDLAIHERRTEVVDLLLRRGADVAARNKDEWTPLMLASEDGAINIVELLLTHGADPMAVNIKGQTSLHIATSNQQLEVVRVLLQRGADPQALNSYGHTPLMMAADRGFFDIADYLLKNGADPADLYKPRNLTTSASSGQLGGGDVLEDVALGENHGTDVDLESVVGRGVPVVVDGVQQSVAGVTELLVKHGADLDVVDEDGDTALHKASFEGQLGAANLLIRGGADLAILNRDGYTALHCASYCGHTAIVELLLRSGANPAATNADGMTAFHCASAQGHAGVVEILIVRDAAISFPNQTGCTPLHVASWEGHTEVVEILLSKDPWDLYLRDAFGQTALEVATGLEHEEIVELLEKTSAAATCVPGSLLNHGVEAGTATPRDVFSGTPLNQDQWRGAPKVRRAVKRFKGFWSRP